MSIVDEPTLAGDFPVPTREEWLDAVRAVILKGVPDADDAAFTQAFNRKLVHRTEDGIDVAPLYTALDEAPPAGLPGAAPFVRGTVAAPSRWEVRQRVWADASTGRAADASTELESGATALLVELPAGGDVDLLDRTLDGVYLDLAPVSLASPAHDDGVAGARALTALWERRSVPADERRGTLGVDPLGAWARTGGTTDLDAGLRAATEFAAELAASAPNARPMVADGTVWHDAGATDAQELAWTVGAGVHAVRALAAAGIDDTTAFGLIELRSAATADQFATIAKLRALRRVWGRVAELAGVDAAALRIFQHADGSRPMLTRYDPWVNTLRSTVACFGAAVGGASAITIWPHDVLRTPTGSALGRRIARNTQTVLQSESNLWRVIDPAGGSWYVEHLTDDLAVAAWNLLRETEHAGGITAALTNGLVARELADVRARRASDLATRRRPITGLSEFPDIAEEPPPPLDTSADNASDAPFEALTLQRLSEPFERQRGRADAHAAATGARPTVFLAALGSPAASTARSTFAKNLFEAGGIVTVTAPPGDYDPAVTDIVCLCSSDAVYAEQGAAAAAELRASGARRVYLAGRGVGIDGVDEEVGAGSDVLDVLERALDELGVAR